MEKKELFLKALLDKFSEEGRYLISFILHSGDAEQPVAYLAARAFERDRDKYEKWLVGKHDEFGTMNPLEVLEGDGESWLVKKALLIICLQKSGLWIQGPRVAPVCEKIQTDTGPTWVLKEGNMRAVP